ncbi:MAG: D-alanyl-D-alanine carboxypeptidase/D-alanyl-D-alanine-endopeptidase [Cyanobacteria bacterium REEB67]|nr:D-alanyl-D-alanine carboxypeptidase/D-alanyl-D-alanine-endopeptidase [Cyanobacteria bacterium REEB67]
MQTKIIPSRARRTRLAHSLLGLLSIQLGGQIAAQFLPTVSPAQAAWARTHIHHSHQATAPAVRSSAHTRATVNGGGIAGGDYEAAVNSWLKRPEIAHSRVGVEVIELPSGRLLYSHDGEKRLTPASTTKVITTSAAYELLGPDFKYKTTIDATGPVVNGVVKGDLILQPSQDPSFNRSDLLRLIDDMKNGRGGSEKITQVEGNAYVGGPPEGHESFQPTWLSEDFGQDWMPASSSLVIDRNIAFASGFPKQFHVSDDKSTGHALLDSLLSSGEAASWVSFDAPRGIFHIYRGSAYSPSGTNDPAIKHDGPFVVANPDAFNQAIFQAMVAESGIKLGADHGSPKLANTHALAEHVSKPLSLLIKHCLYESDNLYAQQLLRSLGATTLGVGSPTGGKVSSKTLEDRGLFKLGDWLASIGVPNQEVVLFDGCGLSRKDCLSPHALNLVLKHMAGPEIKSSYLNLMHQTGAKDGSGLFRLKTGAMDTVRGITGVLTNFSGQNVAVTAIINGHTPSVKNVRMALGDLIERLKRVKTQPSAPPPAAEAKETKGTKEPKVAT